MAAAQTLRGHQTFFTPRSAAKHFITLALLAEIKQIIFLKILKLKICFNFDKLGGASSIEVNFMAFSLHKFSRAQHGPMFQATSV
jgi:hypothetical protein